MNRFTVHTTAVAHIRTMAIEFISLHMTSVLLSQHLCKSTSKSHRMKSRYLPYTAHRLQTFQRRVPTSFCQPRMAPPPPWHTAHRAPTHLPNRVCAHPIAKSTTPQSYRPHTESLRQPCCSLL